MSNYLCIYGLIIDLVLTTDIIEPVLLYFEIIKKYLVEKYFASHSRYTAAATIRVSGWGNTKIMISMPLNVFLQ